MAVAIPVSTSVRISYEVGEEKKNEIINNVKDTALDDDVYEVAASILSLLNNDGLPVIQRRDYTELSL